MYIRWSKFFIHRMLQRFHEDIFYVNIYWRKMAVYQTSCAWNLLCLTSATKQIPWGRDCESHSTQVTNGRAVVTHRLYEVQYPPNYRNETMHVGHAYSSFRGKYRLSKEHVVKDKGFKKMRFWDCIFLKNLQIHSGELTRNHLLR